MLPVCPQRRKAHLTQTVDFVTRHACLHHRILTCFAATIIQTNTSALPACPSAAPDKQKLKPQASVAAATPTPTVATAAAAPPKRGRRGTGEEGASTSRAGGRGRRHQSSASIDEDGDGRGSGGGTRGGGDQLLLRDRRSRIAARALRSSGSVFDMGSIVKGIGSSWLSGGEQLEELRVVRVEERDVLVDPPVVPPGLLKFLEDRRERRRREVSGCRKRGGAGNRGFCRACGHSRSSTRA